MRPGLLEYWSLALATILVLGSIWLMAGAPPILMPGKTITIEKTTPCVQRACPPVQTCPTLVVNRTIEREVRIETPITVQQIAVCPEGYLCRQIPR